MNFRNTKFNRIISLCLIFVFIISCGFGNIVFANEQEIINSSINEEVYSQDKIDSVLNVQFSEDNYVTYIIKMKEQGDLNLATQKATNVSMLARDTPSNAKLRVHNYVLNELTSTAEETQETILTYLNNEKKSGKVKSVESFYIVNAIVVCSTKEVMETIAIHSSVEKITEDKTYKLEYIEPTETEIVSLSSSQDSENLPWNLENISVKQAWDSGYTGTGVVVANMDSGVDYNHVALQNSWLGNEAGMEQYSWFDAVSDSVAKLEDRPYDGDGHGTHVMGTMVGVEDDGSNPIGVAPNAKWISVRVFDDDGETTSSLIMRAGQWLLAPTNENGVPQPDKAPDVINNSWGGDSSDEFFRDVVSAWRNAGIVPIFSAGNTSYTNLGGIGSVGSPARYPEAIAVGAVDRTKKIAYFSLLGPSPYGETKPEISAPGVNIRSSLLNGKYGLLSGTSMSSPHVAGVVALIVQANPNLTVDQIENVLINSADPLVDNEYVSYPNNAYGYGHVNAYKAVKLAEPEGEGFGTVTGHTTIGGEDYENPFIDHIPVKSLFNVYDSVVEAIVADNFGIKSVVLNIKAAGSELWEEIKMDLVSGNKVDGLYQAKISAKILDIDGMKYYIKAEDVAGNIVETDQYDVTVSSGVTVGYYQDFETNIDGFQFGGTTPMWEWGVPVTGPESAVSGDKVVATRLNGSYSGLVDAIMVTPVIDLTDDSAGKAAALTFNHWYDLGDASGIFSDTAEIWIGEIPKDSTDPEEVEFSLIRIYKNSKKSWDEEYIDLGAYKGKKILVMFGLRYGGWSNQEEQGWYVDDLKVIEPSIEIPPTPFQYLSFRFNMVGTSQISFTKIADTRVSSYVMYRSTTQTGPFEPVAEVNVSDIQYSTVTLIDTPLPQVGTYYYYATSKIGDNESGPTKIFSHTFTEGKSVVKFDFESGDQGWTSTASDDTESIWTRGELDWSKYTNHNMPVESTSKGKNLNSPNVWGTELHDFRKANKNYILESPVIDLSGESKTSLYFQTWFNTFGIRGWEYDDYYNDDYGYIELSADGGETWNQFFILKKDTISSSSRIRGAWYLDKFNIPTEYLTEGFKIKFILEAKSGTSGPGNGGWYLDDVEIMDISSLIIGNTEDEDSKHSEDTVEAQPFSLEGIVANGLGENVKTVSEELSVSGQLPISANITIQETGISVKSEEGSGAYSLKHPVGNYTMIIETPSYKTQQLSINIAKDKGTLQNVTLRLLEKSSLKAIIKDSNSKSIKGAKATILGVTKISTVESDEFGKIIFDQLEEGQYTLKITSEGFRPNEILFEIEEGEVLDFGNIFLQSIHKGHENELAYDTGEATSKAGFTEAGGTYGVRMTPTQEVQITGAKFFFTDGDEYNDVKNPEGKEFQYSIYADNQKDGFAGEVLAGPFTAYAAVLGEWTEVTLPETVVVSGDFFLVYTQVEGKASAPRIGLDGASDNQDRSFVLNGGTWKTPSVSGAIMMRSLVAPVSDVTIVGISATPKQVTLNQGQATALTVTAINSIGAELNITDLASYQSNDSKIALVDNNGIITGVSAGDTNIIVNYKNLIDNLEYSVNVQVTVKELVSDITIVGISATPKQVTLNQGQATALTVTAINSIGAELNITDLASYQSNDSKIASVDNNGIITGASAGDTNIIVNYKNLIDNLEYSVNVQVTVKASSSGSGQGSPTTSTIISNNTDLKIYINGEKSEFGVIKDEIATLELKPGDIDDLLENKDILSIKISNINEASITLPLNTLIKNKACVVLELDSGAITISIDALRHLQSLHGDTITVTIKKGSFVVGFEIDGKTVSYDSVENPLLVRIPVELSDEYDSSSYVAVRQVVGKTTVIPYSAYQNKVISFYTSSSGKYDVEDRGRELDDIKSHWGKDSVRFVVAHEIFNGISENSFDPDGTMTRGMFAVVLANLEQVDLTGYSESSFDDVNSSDWYGKAIAWAAESGLIQGIGNSKFAPNSNITREQMAVILNSYLTYKNFSVESGSSSAFTDSAKISTWAKDSISAIQSYGIINGRSNGNFDPSGNATRAEVATIFKNMVVVIVK